MWRMRKKYRLSKRASQDLAGIWRYTLEKWSREQANVYVSGLLNSCSLAADCPTEMGRSYSHIQENYWTYHWGSHIIFYRIEKDNTVSVVRILHEQMDFDRHL